MPQPLRQCQQCSFEKLRPYDRFCPKCGKQQASQRQDITVSPDQLTLNAHKELIKQLSDARSYAFKRSGIAFVIAITAVILLRNFETGSLLLLIPFALFIHALTRRTKLTQNEYNQVINARAIGHHCIFYGGKGIYRRTIYKTNNTLADCSKCKTNLWVE